FCSINDVRLDDDRKRYALALDRHALADALREPDVVLCTTYQGLPRVAQACDTPFDLVVLDEAHRTCGPTGKKWALALSADFPATGRLGLTATPRYAGGEEGCDYAMDDSFVYGQVADTLPYREAQKM